MQVQTHGLLSDIKNQTWSRGDSVVSWPDLEAFMARFGPKDCQQAIYDCANDNMLWVDFQRDSEGKITSALFGASK
jgi:hypothetical protein